MSKVKSGEKKLVSAELINLAVSGDEIAINKILEHYSGYIDRLSKQDVQDEFGNLRFIGDPYLKRLLETQLIVAILKFKVS
ncbi:helix-turn-helix domain-containing protein [Clostridiales Family XIII bacterium ASD5510]|uniref:Helix-turn-helix domain-containing protein n=1 Tax=Hominibacterium faecale TaxID=2839743 RepID=A0A9J6QP34_9FIRM|nr:helix-turn-helix domain-containing protein [Hominibacterium faecale]MCU7378953.1 helix-turn-helix domain-containing protein [Hominibacterium faecale]